jgi:hypothetical protein
MITVSILINGHPVYTRSAINVTQDGSDKCTYRLDTGQVLTHKRSDGAVRLAKKMLDTIQET